MRYLGLFLFALILNCSTAWGAINPIAVSGDNAPGLIDAKFATISLPNLNPDGAGVFHATLEQGPGGITDDDDSVVFRFDSNGLALLAREGGIVSSVANAHYQSFLAVAIDDLGKVVVRGELRQDGTITASNNQGLWHYSSNSALLARTGSTGVPGLGSANFNVLPFDALRLSANGHLTFNASLSPGNGISITNDRGLWSYFDTTGTLVLQEGVHSGAGVPSSSFNSFVMPSVNDNGVLAFNANLNTNLAVSTATRSGIWKYPGSSTGGVLLARAGMLDAPGLDNKSFLSFSPPVINNAGQVAFNATANLSDLSGIWLYTENVGQLKAFVNSGGVPGIPGANFTAFRNVLLSDSGEILFGATLQDATGGVSSSNSNGLWLMDHPGNDRLLLRTGSGGVPSITDANFLDLTNYAINEIGVVAIAASLEIGPGNVSVNNDSGLWIVDPDGISTLVAREGDSLAGRTVESLSFMSDSGGSDGHSTGFNKFNQLLFQATFTNGDEGLFLYSPNTSSAFSPADFNLDGYVDAADLSWWSGAYGTSNAGDADHDGDTDGSDFLIWQREFTGSPAPLDAVAVPEPSVYWLLMMALGFSQYRIALRAVRYQ